MEGLSRLVTESLARHGFDRPVDYRRLHWSRWFRCDSPHSLLFVPSKPGIFVLAEEMIAPNHNGAIDGRRMLAVLQFCEDDDMAFVLDRMFSRENPMRARLASGRVFVRFVVIEDQIQRRSICGALNQWLISSSDSASGIGAHFATSLELTNTTENPRIETARMDAGDSPAGADAIAHSIAAPLNLNAAQEQSAPLAAAQHLDSGAAANLHCPSPLPSGF
jgi:hypothetical protein